MLLPPSKLPLKTSANRILAFVHSSPVQMSHKISGIAGLKFTKFLSGIDKSSSMFMQQSALRCSHPLLNVIAQNEGGACQHAPLICYHSNVPWASRRNQNLLLWSRLTFYIFWKFGEDQSRHSRANIGTVRILAICVHQPTHANAHNISGITEPKFTIFSAVDKSSLIITQ